MNARAESDRRAKRTWLDAEGGDGAGAGLAQRRRRAAIKPVDPAAFLLLSDEWQAVLSRLTRRFEARMGAGKSIATELGHVPENLPA